MKKIVLSAAIVLASLSIYATTITPSPEVNIEASTQTEYTEISTDTVPAAVTKALQTAYPGAKLVKAYVNDKKEYKLDISVGDQKATVYSDVNGNWLKI
jgi:hypothetical protein